jgi:tRNA threonylcarbamoyladenosine biosynthesis protein TsaE
MIQFVYTLNDMEAAVRRFWDFAAPYRIYAFSGDMGAGKTTFISSLCSLLGVTDTVSSPTFALIHEYAFPDKAGQQQLIFHTDCYRIQNEADALHAGIEDCLSGHAYCFIEWPERILNLLHSPYVWCTLEVAGENKRRMTITLK